MDLGDRVIVEQPGHPHNRKTGVIVGRRGEKAPGEFWYLVFIELNRRSYLFTGSMLRVIEEKRQVAEIRTEEKKEKKEEQDKVNS